MTANKKRKKAIKRRASALGRSYQGMLRAEQGPPGRFESIVWKTIHLVDAWREEEAKRGQSPGGSDYLEQVGGVLDVIEYLRNPLRLKLLDHLTAQSDDDVYKMIAVMYAGRDDDSIPLLIDHVRRTFPEKLLAIRQMMEKSPLASYLRDGLRQARIQGVDLEGKFEDGRTANASC